MADIRIGSWVLTSDGKRLGRLVHATHEALVIERGTVWPREFTARRDDVIGFDNGDIKLGFSHAELRAHPEFLRRVHIEARDGYQISESTADDAPESVDVGPPAPHPQHPH